MKKLIIFLLFIIGASSSCSDYLDIVPDNIPTIELAFNNRSSAKSFLFTCYNRLPDEGSVNSNPALCGGDEVWLYPVSFGLSSFFGNTTIYELAHGLQNSNNPYLDYWMGDRQGKNLFIGIRDCNIFLENIDDVPDLDDWEKKIWVAEVKFLKAYYHYYLLRMYGPIPITDVNLPISASPEEVKIVREPVTKVVQYIVDLIEETLEDLPLKIENATTENGRITKTIAVAVQAKALILGASPIFNRSGVFTDLVNSDGEQLVDDTDNNEKWVVALEKINKAIEIAHEAGHSLYSFTDARTITDTTQIKMSIRGAVTDRWNEELIWGSTFSSTDHLQRVSQARFKSGDIGNHSVRNLLAPTLRMAELYYSENGVPISEDVNFNYDGRYETRVATYDERFNVKEGYETANLHFNREPRFYASLAFDGSIWYGNGKYDDSDPYHTEMKARQFAGVTSTEKISITGYLTKKLVNYENVIGNGSDYSIEFYPFPIIRLADLYLLHAEAANETGASSAEVFKYLDQVRERAGLIGVLEAWNSYSINPDLPSTQDGRRQIIKQERLIELAFEGHRLWDLYRWLDAEEIMNKPINAWNVFEESTNDFYKLVTLHDMKFSRKNYLWPIQISELLVNNNLVQNPGWN